MTTNRSRRRTGIALAGVLVVLLALSACGRAKPQGPITVTTTYVALGDSYTAVSGTGPYTNGACYRSEDDYPSLVAEKLGLGGTFVDASCGGATSADLQATQVIQSGGSNPPQLDSVTKDTKLVTLGMGLNNSKLLSFYPLYSCLPLNGKTQPACTSFLKMPESAIDNAIATVGQQVRANIAAIREAAPNARIVLVGYPRLVSATGACPSQVPVPAKALAWSRHILIAVNTTLSATAKSAGVDYIDTYKASAGHDVCSADPWVNGQREIPGKALEFHPFAAYHVAVADQIVALLKK
ncbi:MAG TPA: SGNH/GDSL hydrolase family protein [Marmoricola sp.]|jgi:lysophospholipase L1-like esterase|nr:SGNH/GDSL hydrolase family protein [Marmoricola sp.]